MKKYKIQRIVYDTFDDLYQKYPVVLDTYINKNGFGLSEIEINEIYQHIQALENFLSSDDTHALIFSTIKQPNFIDSDFSIFVENDWNFILLRQERPHKYLSQQGYNCNYKWADMNYVISREGAVTILGQIKQIDKLYSDIILDLLLTKKLTGFVIEDDGFDFDRGTLEYDESRNKEILSTIFKINRWSQRHREKARILLKIVFQESMKLGLDLFLNEGTLLGCIRHGEIMQWDDDVDVAVNTQDVDILLDSLKQNEDIEIRASYLHGRHLYYKIWLRDGDEIQGHSHKFPFVDIWLFEIVDSQLKYSFGYSYPLDDIFPLSDFPFESTMAKIPKHSLSYLNTRYPSWDEKIIFFPYCHREERQVGKRLEAYISVDSTGRMK